MANILKQIKVGSTTYNIEPYTSYLPTAGGSVTGELKLYAASGDSPRLTFQRGDLTDSYNDWSIYDSSGTLYLQQRGSGSTAWETRGAIDQYGVNFVGTISENGTLLANKYAAAGHTHSDLVPKNHNYRFYPFIGSAYRKANYKVTLPISGRTSSSAEWMMITMELILGGSYNSGTNGTIFLSYYFLKHPNNVWSADNVRAIGIGNKLADNEVRIQYDISNPGVFYVHSNNNEYNSFSIQNLTANDTAPNFDFTKTTIEPVDSIPSGLAVVPLTCLDSKGDNKLYVNNTAVSLNGHAHNYLPLTGGTMTGAISYKGTQATYPMIKWIDNTADNYGNGIRIGGGGATIIGGGESADLPSFSGGNEVLYLMNDAGIDFYSNCQDGLGSAKHMTFDTSGNLNVPANVDAQTISVDTINGHTLGNALLRQNTTNGDVILGSTVRPLRLWGNQARPSYSTNDGASYSDLALLSDLDSKLNNYGNLATRPNGNTFTFPSGANPVQMRSGATTGNDIGIFRLSDDNAFICNSSDDGYAFAVFDTDQTTDFSTASNAAFAVLSNHAGVSIKGGLTVDGTSVSLNGHTHSYLPLSGGALSGTLDLSSSSNGIKFNTSQFYVTNMICGSVSMDVAVNAGSVSSKKVTYTENGGKGSGSWHVMITPAGSYSHYISVGVTNLSNTGFTILTRAINNIPPSQKTLIFHYVAVKYF